MRIYKMTATFGKLEHETLALEPGMNVIHAPNEWGKSTWSAFLLAMFYGLDTRAKTTKSALADKERYAPWSGSPMSGRIDLNWNGRDITIERTSRGRIPMGEFRAYETASGLDIPELTAANCGTVLLGAEQSVFRRAGFLRLSDLPVTQDDALRARLNALVTTGDESGDAERLAKALRDLKNRCRYNRSGLLPQAEAEREELKARITELESLQTQCNKLTTRLGEVKEWVRSLENHRAALAFAAARDDADRVDQARDARDQALKNLRKLESSCNNLPSREETEKKIQDLRSFQQQWTSAQMEAQMLPALPIPPETPEAFRDMPVEYALEMVREDSKTYRNLQGTKPSLFFFVIGGVCLLAAAALAVMKQLVFAGGAAAVAAVLLIFGFVKQNSIQRQKTALEEKYGSSDPERWLACLQTYVQARKVYQQQTLEHRSVSGNLDVRMDALQKRRQSLCGGQTPEQVMEIWQQVLARWDAYHAARREARQAEQHLQAIQAMAKTAKPPVMEDHLTYSETETARLLSDGLMEQQRLQNRLGQHQGRMEALGDRDQLQKQLAQVRERIGKLEDTYAALTLAQDTLAKARLELQRRFAPRISQRAQELMRRMTAGRYDRLSLGESLDLRAGAGEENILREALWRSDGTVDQLYLALRLAVAETLTPKAPLILDDALVRFDDTRLKAALEILREESQTKQVILFTCQSREKNALHL